jgi:hypothetical protein
LRKNVAFDRLLARLLVVAPDRWVLKGALALDYRLGHRARTTKDIDLVRRDDVAVATMDFLAVQTCDLDDYFTFAMRTGAELPPRLPPPPVAWSAPYLRMAHDVGVGIELAVAYQAVARMLDPVLAGQAEGMWDPAQGMWLTAQDRQR